MPDLGGLLQRWIDACSKLNDCGDCQLFQEIWVKDGAVVAVKPQPDFEPFFKMNWEECRKAMKWRPRGDSNP